MLPKHSGVTRSMLPFPFYNFPYSVFRLPFPDFRLPFPVSRLPSLVFRLPPPGTQPPETDLQWSFHFHFHLWGRTGRLFSSPDLLGTYSRTGFQTPFSIPQTGLEHEALGSGFGSQNRAKIEPNPINTDQKSTSTSSSVFSLMFGRFRSRKWKLRTPLVLPKPFGLLYGSENQLFRQEAICASMLVPTWLYLGTILGGNK